VRTGDAPRAAAGRLPRPPKELKAFRKIAPDPGESKTVRFELDLDTFSTCVRDAMPGS